MANLEKRPLLLRDFRSLALAQIQEAATRHTTKVEVPDSAVGHIIGKAHRTINALGHMPGITHVSVHEDLENEDKQIVLVEGSEDAIGVVLAQINRLHMRSCAASVLPEMHYACFVVDSETPHSLPDDPIILRIASEEKLSLHMPQHLRSFVYRHFPEDFDDRTYYYFHSRSSGEAAALSFIVQPPAASEELSAVPPKKPSIRRKLLEKTRASLVLASWEKTAYHSYLCASLTKLLHEAPGQGHAVLKIRLVIGKTLYYGTNLCKGDLWKLSVGQMDDRILYQTLRPTFSIYSSAENIRRGRRFLHISGYRRVSFSQVVSAELVDMDSEPDSKQSYHFEMDRSSNWSEVPVEPLVRFCKVSKRHTFLTFLNGHKGVDMELRLQSRDAEDSLDLKTKRSLYEAWHEVGTEEHPLVSPSGKRYFPLNVLYKDAETYRKGAFEVAFTKVTAARDDVDTTHDEKDLSNLCRWKVSIRSLDVRYRSIRENVSELEIAEQAKDILHHIDLLLSEASKLAMSMASCS
ncbi:unnamed protein product [Calypogeia fissa]